MNYAPFKRSHHTVCAWILGCLCGLSITLSVRAGYPDDVITVTNTSVGSVNLLFQRNDYTSGGAPDPAHWVTVSSFGLGGHGYTSFGTGCCFGDQNSSWFRFRDLDGAWVTSPQKNDHPDPPDPPYEFVVPGQGVPFYYKFCVDNPSRQAVTFVINSYDDAAMHQNFTLQSASSGVAIVQHAPKVSLLLSMVTMATTTNAEGLPQYSLSTVPVATIAATDSGWSESANPSCGYTYAVGDPASTNNFRDTTSLTNNPIDFGTNSPGGTNLVTESTARTGFGALERTLNELLRSSDRGQDRIDSKLGQIRSDLGGVANGLASNNATLGGMLGYLSNLYGIFWESTNRGNFDGPGLAAHALQVGGTIYTNTGAAALFAALESSLVPDSVSGGSASSDTITVAGKVITWNPLVRSEFTTLFTYFRAAMFWLATYFYVLFVVQLWSDAMTSTNNAPRFTGITLGLLWREIAAAAITAIILALPVFINAKVGGFIGTGAGSLVHHPFSSSFPGVSGLGKAFQMLNMALPVEEIIGYALSAITFMFSLEKIIFVVNTACRIVPA